MSKQGMRNGLRAEKRADAYRGERLNAHGIAYGRVDEEQPTLSVLRSAKRGFVAQGVGLHEMEALVGMYGECAMKRQKARVECFRPQAVHVFCDCK